MKKYHSFSFILFLAIVLIVSVLHFSATAVQSGKLSSELKTKLDAMSDDDTIAVSITYGATRDEYAEHEEWDRLTDEITEREYSFAKATPNKTIEQVNLWRQTRIGVMKERNHQHAIALYQKFGIEYSEVIGGFDPENVNDKLTDLFVLPKAKILDLTDFDEILSIESYSHFQETSTEPETEGLTEPAAEQYDAAVKERFEQWAYDTMQAEIYTIDSSFMGGIGYYEPDLVYCHTADGVMDWALIHVMSFPSAEWEIDMRLGGRIIHNSEDNAIFRFDYGVYDTANDTFYDLYDIRDRADDYPGLDQVLDDLKIGRPLGDADSDGELSVLDATRIQRIIAELTPAWNDGGSYLLVEEISIHQNNERKFADYDYDGDITILDATAIQRKLAGLTTEA